MGNNYYAADFNPWVNNIRGIGTMMMQMPAIRARAAAQREESALRQAEITRAGAETGEANARTGLIGSTQKKTDAQTADLQDQTESGIRLSAALKKLVANPNDPDATGDAISEFGHYFKKNPEQAAKAMGDLLSHVMAMRGDTNFATQGSLQGNAASIANNQANNTRIQNTPMVVPDNSVAIDKTTGQPVATSPQRLSMGQRLFTPGADNVTLDTTPEVQGAPAPAKSSAADAERSRLLADLVKGGNSIDPSMTGTNAGTGLKLYDALAAKNGATGAGAAPTSAPASASAVPETGIIVPGPAGKAAPTVVIPPTHVAYLHAHPEAAGDFDAKYGAGSAAAFLKQATQP